MTKKATKVVFYISKFSFEKKKEKANQLAP